MDIRESVISSVFFHAIMLLVMLAASSAAIKKTDSILMVDFSSYSGKTAEVKTSPQALQTAPPSEDAISIPEETVTQTIPEEEKQEAVREEPTVETAEPERPSSETTSDPGNSAPVIPDELRARMVKMHYMLIMHTMQYVEATHKILETSIDREMSVSVPEGVENAFAEVLYIFDEKGSFRNINLASNSEHLLELMKKVDWRSAPYPSMFMLKLRGLLVHIVISNGKKSLSVYPI